MITKSIVKDYIDRRCSYLVKASLEDKTLIQLIKQVIELDKYSEFEENMMESFGDDDDEEKNTTFDILEIVRDYPQVRGEVEKIKQEAIKSNPLNLLLSKYEYNQLTADLSRRYIELLYGADKCRRCDLNDFGASDVIQTDIVKRTKEALKDPNIKVLFEGQIEHNDLRARFDALIKEDDGTYTIIEAKGTTSVFKHPDDNKEIDSGIKKQHLYDLLFQYYVYSTSGINISKLGYLYLDKNFKYSDDSINYPNLSDNHIKKLFKLSFDMNYKKPRKKCEPTFISIRNYFDDEKYVDKDNLSIEELLEIIRSIASSKDGGKYKHYECVKGGKCPFLINCFPDSDEEDSIFRLTRWNEYGGKYKSSKKLIDEYHINKISELTDNLLSDFPEEIYNKETGEFMRFSNANTQIKFQKEWKKSPFNYLLRPNTIKEIVLNEYINESINYLIFFDFESIQNPVPLMKDSHPWQQVVTQYSMHILRKDYDLTKHDFEKGRGGNCSHYEFIGQPSKDGYENPEYNLFITLRDQLIDFGIDPMGNNYRVVVFNQKFEKTRMKEFVNLYSNVGTDLINFVNNFNNNVVDLLKFFTSGAFYGREFHGKGSLKVVQPKLCTDPYVIKYYKSIGLPFDFKHSLDYHKESALVCNGGICLDLYKTLLVRQHVNPGDNNPDEKEMLNQALAYCKIDSWGTVIIFDIIRQICNGKIHINSYNK